MEFWKAIEQMDFNGRGSKAAGRWLVEDSGLSIEQLKEIRNVANRKASYMMRLLNNVTGVSDDAFSDVCWQIIANGQEAYKNATVESTQEMIDNNEYTESFAYAFHEVDDAIEEATFKSLIAQAWDRFAKLEVGLIRSLLQHLNMLTTVIKESWP